VDASDDNLIKHLDLIHFWEPFERDISSLRIGIRAILDDRQKKRKEIRARRDEVDSVKPTQFTKPYVFSFNTVNQRDALFPLFESVDAELISENPDFSDSVLPDIYLKAESLKFTADLFRWFYSFRGRDRDVFRARYYEFYKRLGQYGHYHRAFTEAGEKVKAYVASNDHSGLSQVGFVAARKAGIPTVYVQHASVSEKFPPLRSTVAFLDGEDAKEKYLSAGPTKTKIHLIGTMKYDAYLRRPELSTLGDLVGVCIGLVYHDLQENFELCEALERQGIPFCLRFHPLMEEGEKQRFTDRGWEVSPTDEKALDFILRCHTIVSGDSNILLEAIVLKRRPLYFASDGLGVDYYGFVRHGVCERAYFRHEEVLHGLGEHFDLDYHREQARRYNSVLGTEEEGRSTERAVELLEALS